MLHPNIVAHQTWLEGYEKQASESRTDATAEHPCPICGAVKLCYFDARAAGTRVVCRYIESLEPHPGLEGGGCCGKQGWFHDLRDGAPVPTPTERVKRTPADVGELSARCVQDLAELRASGKDIAVAVDRVNDLPDGSYEAAIADLGAVDTGGPALTIPEYDGSGRVIGIQRRFLAPVCPAEKKKRMAGTSSGLTVPRDFDARAKAQGVVYVVEGESDVVAMHAAGLCAVGQPGQGNGGDLIAELMTIRAPGAVVVIVEEVNAAWSAIVTAGDLEMRGVAVSIARTPEGDFGRIKDVRAYLTDYAQEGRPWADRGADLRTALAALAVSRDQAREELEVTRAADPNRPKVRSTPGTAPPPNAKTPPEVPDGPHLTAQRASQIKARATKWLVRNRIIRGALCMLYGPGGVGKSTLASTLVADLTVGRCAFGELYSSPVKGEVILLSAEEDPATTIIPKLMAAGADLDLVHVNPVVAGRRKSADGKTDEITFSPEDLDMLDQYVATNPNVVAVVVDPVSSYIGRTGIDDNRASELRTALDPLNQLCIRRNVTVIALAHPNKNSKAGIADRISGSAAYKDASRLTYAVGRHPTRDDARVMVKTKTNKRVEETAVVYREEDLSEDDRRRIGAQLTGIDADERAEILAELRKVVFDEPEHINEGTLFDAPKTSPGVTKAADAIRDLLMRRRQMRVTDLIEELVSDTVSEASLRRAMSQMDKHGIDRWQDGFQGVRWIGFKDDSKVQKSKGARFAAPTFDPRTDIDD